MSSGLMVVILDKEPRINESINLNADNEFDNSDINYCIDTKSKIVVADEYDAIHSLPSETETIGCVAFLANAIKQTAKMKKNSDKITALNNQNKELMKEWKERSLNVNQKTCYSCNSKITQNHNKTKQSRHEFCVCPNCGAKDYLLTKASRTKIEKNEVKIRILLETSKELENVELQKELKKKNVKLKYAVGGWIHESELPRNY